jgi:hypothetical protein
MSADSIVIHGAVQRAEGHLAFSHAPLSRPGEPGSKLTDREMDRLIGKLRAWILQFDHPEALALRSAFDDLEAMRVRVWTEIDESLVWLHSHQSSMEREGRLQERDRERLAVVFKYLNRWQDRGGRCGNAG